MKKLLLLLLSMASGFGVELLWDANTETNLAGYRAYYGARSREYSTVVDVGNFTSVFLPTPSPGSTRFFCVTAYDTDGLESDFSDEVFYTSPVFYVWRLPAGRLLIESTFGLMFPISWVPVEEITGPASYVIEIDKGIPAKYFRYSILP